MACANVKTDELEVNSHKLVECSNLDEGKNEGDDLHQLKKDLEESITDPADEKMSPSYHYFEESDIDSEEDVNEKNCPKPKKPVVRKLFLDSDSEKDEKEMENLNDINSTSQQVSADSDTDFEDENEKNNPKEITSTSQHVSEDSDTDFEDEMNLDDLDIPEASKEKESSDKVYTDDFQVNAQPLFEDVDAEFEEIVKQTTVLNALEVSNEKKRKASDLEKENNEKKTKVTKTDSAVDINGLITNWYPDLLVCRTKECYDITTGVVQNSSGKYDDDEFKKIVENDPDFVHHPQRPVAVEHGRCHFCKRGRPPLYWCGKCGGGYTVTLIDSHERECNGERSFFWKLVYDVAKSSYLPYPYEIQQALHSVEQSSSQPTDVYPLRMDLYCKTQRCCNVYIGHLYNHWARLTDMEIIGACNHTTMRKRATRKVDDGGFLCKLCRRVIRPLYACKACGDTYLVTEIDEHEESCKLEKKE